MRNIVKYDTQGEKRVITCQKRGPEIPIEHGESSPNTCHIEVNDLHIEVEEISSGNVTTTNPNLKRHFPSNDRKKARIQTSTSRTIDDTCGSHDALSLTPTSSNIQKVPTVHIEVGGVSSGNIATKKQNLKRAFLINQNSSQTSICKDIDEGLNNNIRKKPR